jgi:DNA-nicking Smr family endonuclease
MSKAGQKGGPRSGRGSGTLSDDEAELWQHATRALEPIRAKPRVGSGASPPPRPAAPAQQPKPTVSGKPRAAAAPKVPAPDPSKAPARRSRPAPIAAFDRRKARQIASGKIAIDDRLDLHGVRQGEARARLLAFLRRAQADGCRTVLVITGKGGEPERRDYMASALGEPQRGVLRRSVPGWLAEPEFRAIVLSHTSAGVRHGGDGALYVQLRKVGGE